MFSKSTTAEAFKKAQEARHQEIEEAQQNSLFREVDEDLRYDQVIRLWKRWGGWVVGAALALVLGVAGYQYYGYHRASVRQAQAARFDSALEMIAEGKTAEADKALKALVADGNAGYRTLARMRLAALAADENRLSDAAAILKAESADQEALPPYRDLSLVLQALYALEAGDAKTAGELLAPLTGAGHPWRQTALQIQAMAAAKGGDPAKAVGLLQGILDEPDTPKDQRAIVESLKSVFQHDAEAGKP